MVCLFEPLSLNFFHISYLIWWIFINNFPILEGLRSFSYTDDYCVGAVISTLTSYSDGLGPYIFRWKVGKARPMSEETDGKVFISHQRRHFSLYGYYE